MPFDGRDGYGLALRAAARGIRPRVLLSTSAWAARYRILTSKASAEPGRWNPDRIPYLAGIMDALDETHPAPLVIFIKSSQVGGSECGLNWIGRTMHLAPGPILALFPTEKSARKWVRTRLHGMLAATLELRRLIPSGRKNDNANTVQEKHYPGGVLFTGSTRIPDDVAGVSTPKVLLDEVDRMPLILEDEGDPVDLAKRRATTFVGKAKIFEISTPTIEETSRINADWLASTMDRYFVPCPHCGTFQVMSFDNLSWPDGKPELAALICEECAVPIIEREKTAMLSAGEWRAAHPERETECKGFHINGLYTPIGLGDSWSDHAKAWEKARGKPARVQVFFNTRRGEVVKGQNLKVDHETLKQRAEPYRLRTIPRGVLILTASADVQADRIEVSIVGHGRNESATLVDHTIFEGDPTRSDVWDQVDAYFAQELLNDCGVLMRIQCSFVDSGYLQTEVLNFTRNKRSRHVYAAKGSSITARPPIGRPSFPDSKYRGKPDKNGAWQYQIGQHAIKTTLYGRLLADDRATITERHFHFSNDLTSEYFRQLTAEHFEPKIGRFEKHYERNEALDLMVLALAAAMHPAVEIHRQNEADWLRLESLYAPSVAPSAAPAKTEVLGRDAIDHARGFFPTSATVRKD